MSSTATIALYAKELKLSTFSNYQKVIRQATEQSWSYEEFLCKMLFREVVSRKEKQIARRIKVARFPLQKTLDEFDFKALPHVEEALVWQLAAGEFTEHRENIAMIGNPGTGKPI